MNLEPRKPTKIQIVYDALAQGEMTMQQIEEATGLEPTQIKEALFLLGKRKAYQCNKTPRYSLIQGAQRPADERGRKR